jgi:hypothetical protein
MLQNQINPKNLTIVGEEISHELGAKMVKDFQDINPNENTANYIGRNILERILAQPDCQGIRFYNAINETGRQTLVYVGVDRDENIITQYVGINAAGELVKEKGIVADRSTAPGSVDTDESWSWA